MKIIVPATSANVGPGFDLVGIAVTRYLTIEVLEPADAWFIEHDLGAGIPTDEKNLLLSTALSISTDMQPHRVKMTSEVPLARGLGSSSSVIVAGIELANQLANLQLSDAEKLRIATEIEGHPDNVAPAIFGNMVIASYIGEDVQYVTADFPSCDLVAFVPSYQLKTSDSRNVPPKEWSYKEAVAASSVANVAIAALFKGRFADGWSLHRVRSFPRTLPSILGQRVPSGQRGSTCAWGLRYLSVRSRPNNHEPL